MAKNIFPEDIRERIAAAIRKHRNDPPLLDRMRAGNTSIENTLPVLEAQNQWSRLAKIGILPFRVDRTKDGLRVAYSVPPSVRLG